MLTTQQKHFFDTFGFLIIRDLFTKDEVKTIEEEFNNRATVASNFEPFDGTKRQTISKRIEWLQTKKLIDATKRTERLHKWISKEIGIDLDQF